MRSMNMIPKNLNLARSNEIVKQFHKLDSDRAAAILSASYVEQCLREFIQLFMVEEPQKAAGILLNTRNSVSSFATQETQETQEGN